jgi:hypothetical protein
MYECPHSMMYTFMKIMGKKLKSNNQKIKFVYIIKL